MKKTSLKKPQFPRISRIFPETFINLQLLAIFKKMFIAFIFTSVFIFILFTLADLYRNFEKNQKIQLQREGLTSEINIWKSFSQKYPNYKEVYFQMAVREFELGDLLQSGTYLQKALFIDPNYQEALKLKKELEIKSK